MQRTLGCVEGGHLIPAPSGPSTPPSLWSRPLTGPLYMSNTDQEGCGLRGARDLA